MNNDTINSTTVFRTITISPRSTQLSPSFLQHLSTSLTLSLFLSRSLSNTLALSHTLSLSLSIPPSHLVAGELVGWYARAVGHVPDVAVVVVVAREQQSTAPRERYGGDAA